MMWHCFQFMAIHKKQRDRALCLIGINSKIVFKYNTKSLLISESWRSGRLELLMFTTVVLPNQLCGGSIKVRWTFID